MYDGGMRAPLPPIRPAPIVCVLLIGCAPIIVPYQGSGADIGYVDPSGRNGDRDFRKSKITGFPEVVDDEDALRVRAGLDLVCGPDKLKVFALDASDVPTGWAADVAGCGKTAIYKVAGRAGWAKQ